MHTPPSSHRHPVSGLKMLPYGTSPPVSGLHGYSARLFCNNSLWSFQTKLRVSRFYGLGMDNDSLGLTPLYSDARSHWAGGSASCVAKDQDTKGRGSEDAPLSHY